MKRRGQPGTILGMEYALPRPRAYRLNWILWVLLAVGLGMIVTRFAMNPNNEVKIVPCSKCVGCTCPKIAGTAQCLCPR